MGCAYLYGLLAFDSKWVPPVGGAPSRHIGTGGAADGVHDQCLRDSGAGESSGAPTQAARQADEASRAAEEMRGPPSGRAQEGGRRQPLDEVNGLRDYVVASYGRFLGIAFRRKRTSSKKAQIKRACLYR
jgi:hypothetical protein